MESYKLNLRHISHAQLFRRPQAHAGGAYSWPACEVDGVGKVVPLEKFEAGQSVEIHSGPFVNFIATVEQMASDARVWVLLDFMGKATRVQVDRQQIQAVSPAAE